MKKLFIVFLIMACVPALVFASNADGSTEGTIEIGGVNLAPVARLLTLIIGVFGGIFVLVKGAIDIMHAVTNQEADPQGVRKAIVRFLIAVVIIGAFFGIRTFILNGQNGTPEGTTSSGVFYQVVGMNGSNVLEEVVRPFEIPEL